MIPITLKVIFLYYSLCYCVRPELFILITKKSLYACNKDPTSEANTPRISCVPSGNVITDRIDLFIGINVFLLIQQF